MTEKVFAIAVTGGIGCGKSMAVEFFSRTGMPVMDLDRLTHEVYADPAWLARLAERWGDGIIAADGTLNRRKLAAKVFAAPDELAELEGMVHPELRRRLRDWLTRCPVPAALVEVPLLFESGWQQEFDVSVAVWSPPEVAMDRCLARGWSREEWQRRHNRQWNAALKVDAADYALINSGEPELLYQQCDRLLKHLEKFYVGN